MKESMFKFNPFTIQEWTTEQIKEQYTLMEDFLTFEDTPMEIATDIDTYANMGYLIGEMIARYYNEVACNEAELKVAISNATYRERNDWAKMNTDKAPAMSYFESKAQSQYLEEIKSLATDESNLKRFKYAYDSIDSKQNALKKKLESLKYDTSSRFGN